MKELTKANRERRLISLVWIAVAVSLIVVTAIAYTVNETVKQENEQAFASNLKFLADSSAKSAKLFTENVISDLITTSQLDVIKRRDVAAMDNVFRSIISKSDERLSHMILLGANGEIVLIVTKSPDPQRMKAQIHEFFLDTMNRIKMPDKTLVNISPKLFEAPPYRGIAVGMPIFRLAKGEGENAAGGIFASGMIVALIGVDDIVKSIIDPVQMGKTGFAWLYTGERVLANKEKIEHFAKSLYGAEGGGLDRFVREFSHVAAGRDVTGWTSITPHKHVSKVSAGGESWFISTAKIEILDKQWTMAVAAPEWEAVSLLNRSFWLSVALLSTVVTILVLGGILMARANKRLVRAEVKALHAAELEEKNTILEDLNRRMDEFVAVVSHDIRSPLNVISGFVKMIQSAPEGKAFTRETTTMLRSCNRLMQLVNDILDVSKLEAGKVKLAYDRIVIDDIIEESAHTMEFAAREKSQTVTLKLGEKTRMEGDTVKLLQVMNNLIGNAIKFTPKGGSINVAKKEENNHVTVSVSDTGPGIPADQQGMVFEKFEQIRAHQLGIVPGSGLGLTICKSLVELHGGTIGVSSVSGQGSTFNITIPLSRRANGADNLQPKEGAAV